MQNKGKALQYKTRNLLMLCWIKSKILLDNTKINIPPQQKVINNCNEIEVNNDRLTQRPTSLQRSNLESPFCYLCKLIPNCLYNYLLPWFSSSTLTWSTPLQLPAFYKTFTRSNLQNWYPRWVCRKLQKIKKNIYQKNVSNCKLIFKKIVLSLFCQ